MRPALRSAVLLVSISLACGGSPNGPSGGGSAGGSALPQPLTVGSISPTTWLSNYPAYFTVRGTGFKPEVAATLGDAHATISWLSSTSLSALFLITVDGTLDLVVTNADGERATLNGAATFYLVTLTISPDIVAAGGQLSVSWIAPTRESAVRDWIGVYPKGASSNFGNELGWQYVTGASGTARLPAPAQPGEYEVRYLPNDGEVDVARVPVTVQ